MSQQRHISVIYFDLELVRFFSTSDELFLKKIEVKYEEVNGSNPEFYQFGPIYIQKPRNIPCLITKEEEADLLSLMTRINQRINSEA